MQSLNSYIAARGFFQDRKRFLSLGELFSLQNQLERIREVAVFRDEKRDIDDLMLDIECLVDEKEAELKAIEEAAKPQKELDQVEYIQEVTPSLYLDISVLDFASGNLFKEAERELISQALQYYNGNRTKTASGLGISIRTLRNKLNEIKGEAHGVIH